MITIYKAKEDFIPHIAMTSFAYNGGCATGNDLPVVTKSKVIGDNIKEILKSLGADESTLEKASYNNLRKMLGSSLRDRLEVEGEYSYVYVEDFDEEKVVFEHGDRLQSVSYSLNDNGIVLLGDDYTDVLRHDVYTDVSGQEMILKGAEDAEDADAEDVLEDVENSDINAEVMIEDVSDTDTSLDNQNKKDKEDTMSNSEENNELLKSAEVQDIIEKAIAKDRAEQEAIQKANKLKADTAEVVKGLGVIDEADQDAIVKALVADEVSATVLIKALTDMGAAVIKAKEEVEEVRKSFGEKEQTAEEAQVSETVDTTVVPDMSEQIAKAKAKLKL